MNKILICSSFILINLLMVSCFLFPEDTVTVKLTLNKNIYEKGERIDGEFIIINNSDDDIKFNFNDSKKYGIIISGSNNLNFEINYMYGQSLTSLTIRANDKKEFPINPELQNNDGQLLENGNYSITVYFDIDEKPSSSAFFKIK